MKRTPEELSVEADALIVDPLYLRLKENLIAALPRGAITGRLRSQDAMLIDLADSLREFEDAASDLRETIRAAKGGKP